LSTNMPSVKQSFLSSLSKALGTLFERRWLTGYFVQRELTKSHRNSFLGFVWAFLTPLFMIALYTLVFSEIIGLRFGVAEGAGPLNFGLYVYCGFLPFLAFSDAVNQSTNCIRSNQGLVKRVVFPTEILPLTTAVAAVADKLFGLAVLIVVVAVLGYGMQWTIVLLPVILAVQLLFTLGLSYLFAVIGTYVPDVRETLRAIVRAMFFITPIFWSPDIIPDHLRFIVALNPLAFLVESYRDLVLRGELPGESALLYFALFAGTLFILGFALFVRSKQRFADLL
jgi:ABC-2 type transport system permease protein